MMKIGGVDMDNQTVSKHSNILFLILVIIASVFGGMYFLFGGDTNTATATKNTPATVSANDQSVSITLYRDWKTKMRQKYISLDFSTITVITLDDTTAITTSNCASIGDNLWGYWNETGTEIVWYTNANLCDKIVLPKNCYSLFSNWSIQQTQYSFISLTSLPADKFDTSQVTDMQFMFYNCSSLISLDVSNFDTSNVTNLKYMFCSCSSLTSLDVSNFETRNVTSMDRLFFGCSSLTSLDLSNFNTSNVTEMSHMFSGCSSLTSLDVSNFNTSNVTTLGAMFFGCKSLTSIDVSGFDTNNITSMYAMFSGCSSLTSIDVTNFDTNNVTTIGAIFAICSSLTSVDVTNFDTSNVTNMEQMFSGCSSLTSVDVTNFDTSNVTDMGSMFSSCSKLTSLDLSSFDMSNVTDASSMLSYCSVLGKIITPKNVNSSYNPTLPNTYFNGLDITDTNVYTSFPTTTVGETMSKTLCRAYTLNLNINDGSTVGSTSVAVVYNTSQVRKSLTDGSAVTRLSFPTRTGYDLLGFTITKNGDDYILDENGAVATDNVENYLQNGLWSYAGSNSSTTVYAQWEEKVITLYNDHTEEGQVNSWKYKMRQKFPNINLSAITTITLDDTTAINTSDYAPIGDNLWGYWSSASSTEIVWYTNAIPCERIVLPEDSYVLFSSNIKEHEEDVDLIEEYFFKSLTTLPVEKFDTSQVIDMGFMFWGCESLVSLNLSGWDTSNVTNMEHMFHGCTSLTSFNVSGFNTSNVTNMQGMFCECSSLTSLNLSSFNTSNVTDMSGMFQKCSSLTSLNLSNFNTGNVTDMWGMFSACSSLTSLDVSNFNTSRVTNMYQMFWGCSLLTSLDVGSFNTSNVIDMEGMFYECTSLTKLNLSNFNTANVTTMLCMFSGCSSLTSLNISGFNTGNVTDMVAMFQNCSSLTSLNISGFNTSNVTDMQNMFDDCSSLTSLDVSGFNTNNVTNMQQMFCNCSSITSLDVSGFNTSSATSMRLMFSGCSSVTSLDVSGFATSNVTDMAAMFQNCSSLTSLDLSSFETSDVTNMRYMFCNCSSITSLDVSSFNTGNVTDMQNMFAGCLKLISINLNNFNTSNVIDMGGMFKYCLICTSLDLSSFDMSNVTNITDMLSNCLSLGKIITPKIVNFTYNPTLSSTYFNGLDAADINAYTSFPTTIVSGTMSKTICKAHTLNLNANGGNNGSLTSVVVVYGTSQLRMSLVNGSVVTFSPLPSRSGNTFCGFTLTQNGNDYILNASGAIATGNITNYLQNGSWIYSGTNSSTNVYAKWRSVTITLYNDSTYEGQFYTWKYKMRQKFPSINFSEITTITLNDTTSITTSNYAQIGENLWGYWSSDSATEIVWYTNAISCDRIILPADSRFLFSSNLKEDDTFIEEYCFKSLITLPVEKLDTSQVTDMGYMFYKCESIESLDFSGWDTGNVTYMNNMFSNCFKLTSLNLNSFNTSNVTTMYCMFNKCSSLISLDLTSFATSNVTDMYGMFADCSSLTSLDLTSFDTSKVTTMNRMFINSSSLTYLNWSGFDTSNVTDMYGMFYNCASLTSLDLTSFDTSNVTDMYAMFAECSSLASLNLSSFNTSNVTTIFNMFIDCSSLISLDLSNFDTSNVTEMGSLFARCSSLKSLNLSNFNTSNITGMLSMFNNCSSLEVLDLSSFDTSNVTDMMNMFNACSSLKSINLSSFNTSNVTDMTTMFCNCSSLTTLDLSNFDMSKVNLMIWMFKDCSSLVSLNLTGWNLASITSRYYAGQAFDGTSNLKEIYMPANIVAEDGNISIYNTFYDVSGLTDKKYTALASAGYEADGVTPKVMRTVRGTTITLQKSLNTATASNPSTIIGLYGMDKFAISTGTDTFSYTAITNPTEPNYIFNGYFTDVTGGRKVIDTDGKYCLTAVEGYTKQDGSVIVWTRSISTTLYAQWTLNKFTITYNANGGKGVDVYQQVMGNSTFTTKASNTYSKVGFTFIGWSTSSTGDIAVGDYTEASHSYIFTTLTDITLYATWSLNKSTVKLGELTNVEKIYYSKDPTSFVTELTKSGFTINANEEYYFYVQLPTQTGYSFAFVGYSGWFNDATQTSSAHSTVMNGAVYLVNATAEKIAHTYTIIYNQNKPSNASADVEGITESSVHTYNTQKALSANGYSLVGWAFGCWNTKANGSGTSFDDLQSVLNLTSDDGVEINLFAQWIANVYTVSYEKNKPSNASNEVFGVTDTSNHFYDTEKELTANGYTLLGWTFTGWNTNEDGTGESFENRHVVKNLTTENGGSITLYAQWTANKYTITYKANGGTGTDATQEVEYDSTFTTKPSTIFNNVGYTFSCWSLSQTSILGSYTEEETEYLYDINSNIDLFALWTLNVSRIRLGALINVEKIYYGESQTDISINLTPLGFEALANKTYYFKAFVNQAEGYTIEFVSFTGWFNDGTETSSGHSFTVDNRDYIVGATASKTANVYKITYKANGGIGEDFVQSVTYGQAFKTSNADLFEKTGYKIAQWSASSTGTSGIYTIVNSNYIYLTADNIDLYAVWEIIKYNITFRPNGANGVNIVKQVTHLEEFTTLASNAFERTGYTFVSWSTDNTKIEGSYTNANYEYVFSDLKDVTLFAVWSLNHATIKLGGLNNVQRVYYSTNKNNISNILTKTGFVANANANYYFKVVLDSRDGWTTIFDSYSGWFDDQSEISLAHSFTDDGGVYVVNASASFEKSKFKIIYIANGGVGNDVVDEVEYEDSFVTQSADLFERVGYTFVGWSEIRTELSGRFKLPNNQYTYNDVGDTTLYAIWKINQSTIKLGTLENVEEIRYGTSYDNISTKLTSVGFTADANQTYYFKAILPRTVGYEYTFNGFSGWFDDATETSNVHSFVDNNAYTVSASARKIAKLYKLKIDCYADNMDSDTVSKNYDGGIVKIAQTIINGEVVENSSSLSGKNVEVLVDYDTNSSLVAVPNQNYVFDGWYLDEEFNNSISKSNTFETDGMSENGQTYYAKFVLKTCKITFEVDENDSSTKYVKYGSMIGELPSISKFAKNFIGWFDAKQDGNRITETMIIDDDVIFYGVFETNTVMIMIPAVIVGVGFVLVILFAIFSKKRRKKGATRGAVLDNNLNTNQFTTQTNEVPKPNGVQTNTTSKTVDTQTSISPRPTSSNLSTINVNKTPGGARTIHIDISKFKRK